MFTGLIQSLGKIELINQDHLKVYIASDHPPNHILTDLTIGDSVAVDGICLTVAEIIQNGFIAIASPETLRRSTLGYHQYAAQLTNLETSLRLGSKLGGHFVTGHIDGLACLEEVTATASAWEMRFTAPESFQADWQEAIAPYLVFKGSVAVNGISLTVADCALDRSWFRVAVIPHTYQETNLSHLQVGDWVNIESDILGKYVNRLLEQRFSGEKVTHSRVDTSFLAEHGYL